MKKLHQLTPSQRKNHLRFLKKVLSRNTVYVRGETSFRIVERLHKAGLVSAFVSKWNMFFNGTRLFRELEVRPFGASSDKPLLPRH